MPSSSGLGNTRLGVGDPELARLRWQCRRGLLELDLLFETFLQRGYAGLEDQQRERFQLLLQQPDPDLQAWLLAQQAPPDSFSDLVARIRASQCQ